MTNEDIVFISNSPLFLTEFFVFLSMLFLPEKVRGFVLDILTLALFSNLAYFCGAGSLYIQLGTELIFSGSFGEVVFCTWGKSVGRLGDWKVFVVIVQNPQMFELFRYALF